MALIDEGFGTHHLSLKSSSAGIYKLYAWFQVINASKVGPIGATISSKYSRFNTIISVIYM